MPKYAVTLVVDATKTVIVEAASEKEAQEYALEEAEDPCLCHHCSEQVDVGEFTGEIADVVELD